MEAANCGEGPAIVLPVCRPASVELKESVHITPVSDAFLRSNEVGYEPEELSWDFVEHSLVISDQPVDYTDYPYRLGSTPDTIQLSSAAHHTYIHTTQITRKVHLSRQ